MRENTRGSHRWLRQRHDKLDADQAVGNDANDAADEGGVDDVPLSPEYSIEYYQADEDTENELVSLGGGMAEVFDVHQADSSCGKQTDDGRTEDGKDAASYFMVLMLDDDVRDPYHH